jgi:hypothetical protein
MAPQKWRAQMQQHHECTQTAQNFAYFPCLIDPINGGAWSTNHFVA